MLSQLLLLRHYVIIIIIITATMYIRTEREETWLFVVEYLDTYRDRCNDPSAMREKRKEILRREYTREYTLEETRRINMAGGISKVVDGSTVAMV